jgi:hypothetical protein
MVDSVFESGEPTWSEDLLLILDRKLPPGTPFFDVYPILGDVAVGGEARNFKASAIRPCGRNVGDRINSRNCSRRSSYWLWGGSQGRI